MWQKAKGRLFEVRVLLYSVVYSSWYPINFSCERQGLDVLHEDQWRDDFAFAQLADTQVWGKL
jgi:hypothetical protein